MIFIFKVQGFVNSKRYYGLFEVIRKGAENYYQNTRRNFFNDFLLIHNSLGLTYNHKSATIVFSLVSLKLSFPLTKTRLKMYMIYGYKLFRT